MLYRAVEKHQNAQRSFFGKHEAVPVPVPEPYKSSEYVFEAAYKYGYETEPVGSRMMITETGNVKIGDITIAPYAVPRFFYYEKLDEDFGELGTASLPFFSVFRGTD